MTDQTDPNLAMQEAGAEAGRMLREMQDSLREALHWATNMGFTPEHTYAITTMRAYVAQVEDACEQVQLLLDRVEGTLPK